MTSRISFIVSPFVVGEITRLWFPIVTNLSPFTVAELAEVDEIQFCIAIVTSFSKGINASISVVWSAV